jgi:phosphomannomutase
VTVSGPHYRVERIELAAGRCPKPTALARRMIGPRAIHPAILRDDSIRGIVGETLDQADAIALGAAFGTVVAQRGGKTVVLGFDGRTTSRGLAIAFARGLIAAGMHVLRVGLGPTPMLYFAGVWLRTDAAVMVTESHDPPGYNGFKLTIGGRSLRRDDIEHLGELAAAGAFASGEGLMLNRPVLDAYCDRLIDDLALARPLAVAWDAGNGAAGAVLTKLCTRLPGRHVLLNEMVDGTFPSHHPDPAQPDALEQLRRIVIAEECDVGFAFDGDGDRLGVIDGEGRALWSDQILVLLARDILRANPGAAVVASVEAGQSLFDEVMRLGGHAVVARAGRGPIETKIAETGALLGGEIGGHIFFGDSYYGYADALYAALRLMNVVSRADRSLAALHDGLPQAFELAELLLPYRGDRPHAIIDDIRARLDGTGVELIAVDGLRVKTDDGWWLLRASSRRSALVARGEATTEAGLIRVKAALRTQLEQSGVDAGALAEIHQWHRRSSTGGTPRP